MRYLKKETGKIRFRKWYVNFPRDVTVKNFPDPPLFRRTRKSGGSGKFSGKMSHPGHGAGMKS